MFKIINGTAIAMTEAEIAEHNANAPTEAELTAVSDDWKNYRQALRDVPTQSDPDNITWPTKPS